MFNALSTRTRHYSMVIQFLEKIINFNIKRLHCNQTKTLINISVATEVVVSISSLILRWIVIKVVMIGQNVFLTTHIFLADSTLPELKNRKPLKIELQQLINYTSNTLNYPNGENISTFKTKQKHIHVSKTSLSIWFYISTLPQSNPTSIQTPKYEPHLIWLWR